MAGIPLETPEDVDGLEQGIEDDVGQCGERQEEGGVEVGSRAEGEVGLDPQQDVREVGRGGHGHGDVDEDGGGDEEQDAHDAMVLAGPCHGVAEGMARARSGRPGRLVPGDAHRLEPRQHPRERNQQEGKQRQRNQEKPQRLEARLRHEKTANAQGRPWPGCDPGHDRPKLRCVHGMGQLHQDIQARHGQRPGGEAAVREHAPGHIRPKPQQREDERARARKMQGMNPHRRRAQELDGVLDEVHGRLALFGMARPSHGLPGRFMSQDSMALPSCHSVGVCRRTSPRT